MSRTYSAIKNKYQKHAKIRNQEYIYDPNEPREGISENTHLELDSEFLGKVGPMRRDFKYLTRRLRHMYV